MKLVLLTLILTMALGLPLTACSGKIAPNVPATPTPAATATPETGKDLMEDGKDMLEDGKEMMEDAGDAARNMMEDAKDAAQDATKKAEQNGTVGK